MAGKKPVKLDAMITMEALDWGGIIARLQQFATSELGKVELGELSALPSAASAQESFQQIIEMQGLLQEGHRPYMESIDVFSLWCTRLQKRAVLQPIELKDVRHFCFESIALNETLKTCHEAAHWLSQIAEGLIDGNTPLANIDAVMTPEGDIRSDASQLLSSLNTEKRDKTKNIQKILDRLVVDFDMEPVLQDRYVTNREGRWVLPVKSGRRHDFDGIIHASSQSKQTVFMEPNEIIPVNNRLRQIELEIEEEMLRILTTLSTSLAERVADFQATFELMKICDVRLAQAQMARALEAAPCIFEDNIIELKELRHPILALNEAHVVANTIVLGSSNRILLLSGPNAGGKTVLLKSIGLAAQMARCGLLICAEEGSKIPFFKEIVVGVGDAQSVDSHLSTFAAHLKVLNYATELKSSQNLILIDEICGATDPEEGAALARSFMEKYIANHCFGIVTSHLGSLKSGWPSDSGVANGSLEFDEKVGPTYQFLMGVPGQSLALQTAKRIGVATNILDRAFELLSPESKEYHESLLQIEDLKTSLLALKNQLSVEHLDTQRLKKKYSKLILDLEISQEKIITETRREAEGKIDDLIRNARVDKVFKRHEVLDKIDQSFPTMVRTGTAPSRPLKINTVQDFIDIYPPGSMVYVPQLNEEAVIQGRPNSKGDVQILSSRSMRLTLPWQELKPSKKMQNEIEGKARRSNHYRSAPLNSLRVIDLKGQSITSAIESLESELDQSILNSEDRVKILHGIGPLKKNVRHYLSRSIYIKKWQAHRGEKGSEEGVTWADLKDN